jgi:hypothetical protein
MSDVILFRPKAELDAAGNLAGFVESCRDGLTVFGADLDFDTNVWDVTESLGMKGMGRERERIVFSRLETAADKSPIWMADQFRPFAKAYMRYMHGFRPTKSVGFRLAALRALEAALTESGLSPDPVRTDALVLNRAAQMIVDRYSEAAAYRIGGQLEMIAEFLTDNRLTVVPTRWRNPIKRPGDTVRVGKEFDERRQEKMPTEAALDALPKVFRLATEPVDILVSSVAAILCSAPDRINEVLILPDLCEVHQSVGKNKPDAYGLRWWPAKGADPMVKWIVPSMASVVEEAIGKIRSVTSEARQIARWYEDHPGEIYLHDDVRHLRTAEWLTMDEVAEIIGLDSSNSANVWCKGHGVKQVTNEKSKQVRFFDIEAAVLAMLPAGFPFLEKETGLKYSDALLVVLTNQLHARRRTYRCMIEPISVNQINSGLGGRVKHGFKSIFTRFGFTEPDGSPIKITTHQFRHYLNTLAQAGGMSQLDIAKWSGRKDIRQNAAYDHVTPDQMLQKIREAVGDESQMFGSLAEIPKKVLIPRDEFARLRIPTAHTTDLGFCVHDYTMSPCQLHRDCIHCEDLVCVKGDEEKAMRLYRNLEEARDLLRKAEDALAEGYAGGDRWMVHHQSTVERLSQLCSIMDDPAVPLGAVVQLAPPQGTVRVNDASRNALPPTESASPPTGLLAGIMASMEGRHGEAAT